MPATASRHTDDTSFDLPATVPAPNRGGRVQCVIEFSLSARVGAAVMQRFVRIPSQAFGRFLTGRPTLYLCLVGQRLAPPPGGNYPSKSFSSGVGAWPRSACGPICAGRPTWNAIPRFASLDRSGLRSGEPMRALIDPVGERRGLRHQELFTDDGTRPDDGGGHKDAEERSLRRRQSLRSHAALSARIPGIPSMMFRAHVGSVSLLKGRATGCKRLCILSATLPARQPESGKCRSHS